MNSDRALVNYWKSLDSLAVMFVSLQALNESLTRDFNISVSYNGTGEWEFHGEPDNISLFIITWA